MNRIQDRTLVDTTIEWTRWGAGYETALVSTITRDGLPFSYRVELIRNASNGWSLICYYTDEPYVGEMFGGVNAYTMKKAKAHLSQPYEAWHIEYMKRPYWD